MVRINQSSGSALGLLEVGDRLFGAGGYDLKLPKCANGACPVIYSAPNDEYHSAIMTKFGLQFGKDVVMYSTIDDMSAKILQNIGTLSTSPYFGAIAWTSNPVLPNTNTYNIWSLGDSSNSGSQFLQFR
ncbi:hypothetical protein HK102_002783 [Quaeritorhiza haematococci]|nr:hypothetical protein HK102_002783 [Quaeritorhiza haematococci]